MFEELENNLHPALQRKLFSYVRDVISRSGATVFVTTHSSVVIDMFSKDPLAQIIHLAGGAAGATGRIARTYIEHRGVLDDLDVRASDLLQSNCVVWLEGPSDRTYINRFIELVTDGRVREGVHYQCVFYGGKLLAHLTAEAPETDDLAAVAILRVNRNAILVMDSDRENADDELNAAKRRIIDEMERVEGRCWVTSGREIENYLPGAALAQLDQRLVEGPKPYERMHAFLTRRLGKVEADRLLARKAAFAEQVAPLVEKADILADAQLSSELKGCIEQIELWNGIGPAAS